MPAVDVQGPSCTPGRGGVLAGAVRAATVAAAATAAVGAALLLTSCGGDQPAADLPADAPTGPATTASPSQPREEPESPTEATSAPSERDRAPGRPRVVRTVAEGLEVPWGLAFLPDGSALVTERDSRRVLAVDGGEVREVGVIDEATPQEEGGLLGVAVSPTYAEDRQVYFYLTAAQDNRIVRTTYDGTRLGRPEVVLAGIPKGIVHDGGRLAFGPDGYLYAATGETGEVDLAQDLESLGGKILRLTPEGDAAPGNPFGSPVWSFGHRNVQGLAFDDGDRLWASEFGSSEWDELNRIVSGANYGWPLVEGSGGNGDYAEPEVVWRTDEASPSGLAFLDGHLWLASLQGERLWRVSADGRRATDPVDFFVGDYGRMRTVVVAPDGNLWVTTSNRDGRGDPSASDDVILEISPG